MKKVKDKGEIEKDVDEVIEEKKEKVEKEKEKKKMDGWFVGKVMKEKGGKEKKKEVNEMVK